jgi:hypothetical protein
MTQEEKKYLNEVIVRTKALGEALDQILQDTKIFPKGDFPGARERALAITKTQEAIMWIDMSLKELSTVDPFKL